MPHSKKVLTFVCVALMWIALGLVASARTYAQGTSAQEAGNEDAAAALSALALDFFTWRSGQQPVSGDDIPRVERLPGWLPDVSPEALESARQKHAGYLGALDAIDVAQLDISGQVDARLLRAAIQRVHWELDRLRAPHRNPLFYVQQTLGSVFELLILSSPMDDARIEEIARRLEHFPETLRHARDNLDQPIRPFAEAALTSLENIGERLDAMEAALEPLTPRDLKRRLRRSVRTASRALDKFADRLEDDLDGMQTAFALGPEEYQWFLAHVALIPHTPDELLAQGRQAWNRAVAWDVLERNRNRELPPLPLFPDAEQQVAVAALKENEIRAFLESRDLMTVPPWLQHYRSRPMPGYLAPLSFLGVNDDLTSETRLDENAYRYINEPSPDLPYFQLSAARDPRPLIIHEGVPGHYYQLALSWRHPNPIRRRYIDSSVNEGIAFYVEEMLLQSGLFDYSPRSREIILNYSRLRALRVEIDIRLAVGDFNIEQAARYLERAVPMDYETALGEAVFFAFNPGQAISYQVGKLQILEFLADAQLDQGEQFSLHRFHDYLMSNGNVPIALQRWEFLGRDESVLHLDALGGKPVTVPR